MREFNTIADLKQATDLHEGELVQVLGYYGTNDGGGHQRLITTNVEFVSEPTMSMNGTNSLYANIHADFDQPINVKWFGIKNDASEDVSGKIQSILNHFDGSYTFFFPRGNYLLKDTLRVLDNQNVTGVSVQRDSSNQILDAVDPRGTIFIARLETNNEPDYSKNLVIVGHSTTLANIQVVYDKQKLPIERPPHEYEWTIKSATNTTDHIIIDNVVLFNSFKGIFLQNAGRFAISNVYGNPLSRGICIDTVSDEGRINNVHFWDFYTKRGEGSTEDTSMEKYVSENLIGYEFLDCDGVHVSNCFVWNCHTGFKVTGSDSRGGWINFNNCDIDKGSYACWHIDKANSVNVTNTTCIGNSNLNPAVRINSAGRINFSNVTTHPGTNAHAFLIDGTDEVTLNISNLNTGCLSYPVVVLNSQAKVSISNLSGSKLPPLGSSNTVLDGTPLFDAKKELPVTWSHGNGDWEVLLNNDFVHTTSCDITYLSMRTTPKVLAVTGIFPDSTAWHFIVRVQKDIGTSTAVDYSTTSPLRLHSYGSEQTIYIPFHHGLLDHKSELQVSIAAHNDTDGNTVRITGLSICEPLSIALQNSQIEMFKNKGYFLDPYKYGNTIEKCGSNVRVLAKTIPNFRNTIQPLAGAWEAGDRVYAVDPSVIPSGEAIEMICVSPGDYNPEPVWLPTIVKP